MFICGDKQIQLKSPKLSVHKIYSVLQDVKLADLTFRPLLNNSPKCHWLSDFVQVTLFSVTDDYMLIHVDLMDSS